MSKFNWQAIYEAGEQLNQYPYDFVVSHFFNLRSAKKENKLKVLDLGCGAGNHAIFCAEQGAQVVACDFSVAALEVLKQRAADKGLADKITTHQVDFDDFELPYSGFDIVIEDWLSQTCLSKVLNQYTIVFMMQWRKTVL
jgi:2-polyprenyl-3-methyl-5-hydroxy-6-metoxy-1,4-benzoquinol methylase